MTALTFAKPSRTSSQPLPSSTSTLKATPPPSTLSGNSTERTPSLKSMSRGTSCVTALGQAISFRTIRPAGPSERGYRHRRSGHPLPHSMLQPDMPFAMQVAAINRTWYRAVLPIVERKPWVCSWRTMRALLANNLSITVQVLPPPQRKNFASPSTMRTRSWSLKHELRSAC